MRSNEKFQTVLIILDRFFDIFQSYTHLVYSSFYYFLGLKLSVVLTPCIHDII